MQATERSARHAGARSLIDDRFTGTRINVVWAWGVSKGLRADDSVVKWRLSACGYEFSWVAGRRKNSRTPSSSRKARPTRTRMAAFAKSYTSLPLGPSQRAKAMSVLAIGRRRSEVFVLDPMA